MLDNGFPLATESNVLKELIKPPTILRAIANTVTGKSKYVKENRTSIILSWYPINLMGVSMQRKCYVTDRAIVERTVAKNRREIYEQ